MDTSTLKGRKEEKNEEEDVEDTDSEDDDSTATASAIDLTVAEHARRKGELRRFLDKKRDGALRVQVIGPFPDSEQVSTHCSWGRQKPDFWLRSWADEDKGFVATAHTAFSERSTPSLSVDMVD